MSDWTNPVNGNWSDATKWTGGVPNASGAVANFTVANPGAGTALITFSQDELITIGTLNLATEANDGWLFRGFTGVTDATLRFFGAGGGPASINVNSNGSSLSAITGT